MSNEFLRNDMQHLADHLRAYNPKYASDFAAGIQAGFKIAAELMESHLHRAKKRENAEPDEEENR